ncbi:hypothetical protein JOQ06_025282 [Pogonophryne albipinna]|uniref:Uncharacterized protein n=1 Tax=Pogonophryne albipinna TaxID=1090488 RepID=A0AAD6FEL9_9TELE|nr:hypothetical protein JOQ06_025282 [Pogonophryne albipinna]
MPYGSEDTSSMAIGVSSTLCPNAASRSRSPPLPSSTATAPASQISVPPHRQLHFPVDTAQPVRLRHPDNKRKASHQPSRSGV